MNDFLMTLLIFCAAAAAVIIDRILHRTDDREVEPPPPHIDPSQLDRHIERMHQLKMQRNELDDLITNLKLCTPKERVGLIQFHWQDYDGTVHTLDVYADGTENTKRLITVAEAEREEITASLLRELEEAYSGGNVTETIAEGRFRHVTDTMQEGVEYDG